MTIYLNTYGAYLRKKDDMFLVEADGNKTQISPQKVSTFVIATSAFLSSDAVKLAVENNIDIVMLDDFGQPFGRFWHSRFGSTALIRRKQIEVFESEKGLAYALEWIKNKLDSSIEHLNDLAARREEQADTIREHVAKIAGYKKELEPLEGSVDEVRNTLMAYEGNGARQYYAVLADLIPEPYKFKGRSFRPAKDEFNCMLNYAFGILYSRVEKACIIAGLDPFVGVLHTDSYNKKALVFDLIENYRHLAWRTVFNMFVRKKVNKEFFTSIKDGFKLNKEGKKKLQLEFTEKLNSKVLYNKRKISWVDRIQFDCHNLAGRLIGRIE